MSLDVKRSSIILRPDQTRVLLRPFSPGDAQRIARIFHRIMSIPEDRVAPILAGVSAEFSQRHEQIQTLFLERFEQIRELVATDQDVSEQRRLLIGSYFLAEYSLESAALFNPSIIPHPDQTGLPPGALRFVLSLRATGEGHISSITFRTGIIDASGLIDVAVAVGFLTEPRQVSHSLYEKALFARKLFELRLSSNFTGRVMSRLGEEFSPAELGVSIEEELQSTRAVRGTTNEEESTVQGIWMLVNSNYQVQFQPEQPISERVIFPATPSQRNGIEDARFVRFEKQDGGHVYYATFTAFDGKVIMPELLETNDFLLFRFASLNGPAAENKGMAVFPRKIDGCYAMLSRQDNENMYLMLSDNIHFWYDRKLLLKPTFPWELVQLGNCGSPLETRAGWLVLSHGVGPMRKYCIGAFLLDLHDPSKVIARLTEPLLEPNENEREGYVPNVVYSCGALIHNEQLVIPYGLADHAAGFATVPVEQVLAAMVYRDMPAA